MATVKLIQRTDKINKAGLAPIFAQYTHDSRSLLFSTGVRVEPKYWNEEDREVKRYPDKDLQKKFNKKLGDFKSKIIGYSIALGDSAYPSKVKELYENEERAKVPEAELSRSILALWKDYLETRRPGISPRTYNSEKNSIQALEGFLLKEKKQTLTPESFTIKHLSRLENYLATEAKRSRSQKAKGDQGKALSKNTIAKRLKHFKTFLKYHLKAKGNVGFDLNDLKYKETPAPKVYLTEEELALFESFKFEKEKHSRVRDLFILGCNTGLRISDLKRLDKNLEGGKIKLTTQKNNKAVEIPISPTVRRILKAYDYQLPQYSEDKFRAYLREAFKIAIPSSTVQVRSGNKFQTVPKWELISPHDAIRTFITLSAERGMTFNSIAKIVGKSPAVILKHYLSESQRTADKEMEKAWGASPLRIAK